MRMLLAALLSAALVSSVLAAEQSVPSSDVLKLLKASGAVSYAHKAVYGSGIDDMYLGYGQDDAPVVGVAAKETKTYKKSVTIVAVVPADGKYKVSAAEIPDLADFHGKSQDLTRTALKDITGKVFANEKEARGLVDAVTGATQYLQAIYVSYSLMASKIVKEFTEKPQWERRPLPAP